STTREGKYAGHIRKAADWLMSLSQEGGYRDGLLGNPDAPKQADRYMYGHGFAMLFLASVYGDEDDKDRRERLKDILTRAVKYTAAAQSTQGGWYYTSKMESLDKDEGSVTITQLQALRACRNAGIAVPKVVIDKGRGYVKNSTTQIGGVIYQLGPWGKAPPSGGELPALTAATIACSFNAGEYNSEYCKKWFAYCYNAIPRNYSQRISHFEYAHYYYAQAIYVLGDDGWGKMFPKHAPGDWLTWSKYREGLFDYLQSTQNSDGSWTGVQGWGNVGPVYVSSAFLTILQLDRGA